MSTGKTWQKYASDLYPGSVTLVCARKRTTLYTVRHSRGMSVRVVIMEKCVPSSTKPSQQWRVAQLIILATAVTILSWILCANLLSSSKLLISFDAKQKHFIEYESGEQGDQTERHSSKAFTVDDSYDSELTIHAQKPPSPQNFILVLDFWERMVNVQTALKRIVQIGVDADFVIVEPFVYESKVSYQFSFPQHFTGVGLTPQPASLYFDTGELHATNNFVSYESYLDENSESGSGGHLFIDAVLIFDWKNLTRNNQPFWCEDKLSEYNIPRVPGKLQTWQLAENVQIGGALCVSPSATMDPETIDGTFFDDMFHQAQQHTEKVVRTKENQRCAECVSIAFLNYRKHAFSGYTSATGLRPYKNRSPPMLVGLPAMRIASQLHKKKMGGRHFVTLQMRTGKAWVLSGRNGDVFLPWLSNCIEKALVAVKVAKKSCEVETGAGEPGLYIASDMYNSGWKGGEKCTPEVCDAIEIVKQKVQAEAHPIYFEPGDFNITQDLMGTSSAVDAAMAVIASRFVYASPSNLGLWAHGQRDATYRLGTTTVNCNIF